jgi:hypothetical protein
VNVVRWLLLIWVSLVLLAWIPVAPHGVMAIVLVGVVVAFVLRRRGGQQIRMETDVPFMPAVEHAVRVLMDRRSRTQILERVGLSSRENVMRPGWSLVAEQLVVKRTPRRVSTSKVYFPELISITPSPAGARARFVGLIGQDLRQWEMVRGKIASAVGVPAASVREDEPGVFEVELRAVDPIGHRIERATVVPAEAWSLGLGVDERGTMRSLPLNNVSGVVVGGLPGSGKSAWLASALGAFGSCPEAQFVVIDGKGGQDLSCLRERSSAFLNDDLELGEILAALRAMQDLVRDRIRNSQNLFGSSNFWHAGPRRDVPVVFVVVDECQTFLDPRQLVGKEAKAMGAEIHAALNFLVRKGRSAGVVTILATQKPTADALPTDIRDNASLRVCFGVQSAYAASAVLGDEWSNDSVASPLGAPTGVGVAAVAGRFVRFRAPYTPESAVAEHMARWAHLRREPAALLTAGLNSGQ